MTSTRLATRYGSPSVSIDAPRRYLASHSDAKVHARHVMSTKAMRPMPDAALPRLPITPLQVRRPRDDSASVEASDTSAIVTARDYSTPLSEIPAEIDDERSIIRFESLADDGFKADIAYDAEGFLIDYPGIGMRIR
jgi:hypothetical protein